MLARRVAKRAFPRLAGAMGRTARATSLNWYFVRSLTRPQWLYGANVRIPTYPLTFVPAASITAEDVTLCERLIAAYRQAKALEPADSQAIGEIWSDIIEQHHGKLETALDRADPVRLATALSSMFRESFMTGISSANLYTNIKNKLDARVWSLKYIDQIVSLAEFLGVVRTETPEQGMVGYALKDGLEALVARMEQAIGVPIAFPQVGAPYGIKVGDSLITIEAPEHIYVAMRLNQAIDSYLTGEFVSQPNIVEIGAGFGGTAYWLLQLRKIVGSYTIIDLPLTNVMQGYFLSKVFGVSQVALYGETQAEGRNRKTIAVLPTHAIASMKEGNVDVLLNEDSMPEMPERAVTDYIRWAKYTLRGIFYSYNQEAYSPVNDVPQTLVPEIVEHVGVFKRLTRNRSWVRRGYVEEVYIPAPQ